MKTGTHRTFSISAAFIVLTTILVGCGSAQLTSENVSKFTPPIKTSVPPVRPLDMYNLENQTTKAGLSRIEPLVPVYAGDGKLLASWNPNHAGIKNRPTFVVIHGGHGLTPTNFAEALWLQKQFQANVLVLDSYWSRGQQENWAAYNELNANARALDAIAAARWLKSQGVDQDKLIVVGDSQGGWGVLRLFTDEPFLKSQSANTYKAGIAIYPVCREKNTMWGPQLGPYTKPVLILVGTADTTANYLDCSRHTFTDAAEWKIYDGATHGWNAATQGTNKNAIDGKCSTALNIYDKFKSCRSDKTTAQMRGDIIEFVNKVLRGQSVSQK